MSLFIGFIYKNRQNWLNENLIPLNNCTLFFLWHLFCERHNEIPSQNHLSRAEILEVAAMFKFLVKVVVVVLAIQAALGYLRKEGLVSGEIKINYSVLKKKIIKAIPKEKIAEEAKSLIYQKIKNGVDSQFDQIGSEFSQKILKDEDDDSQRNMLIHIVSDGETLRELSEKYGVPDKVIKKINNLRSDRDLKVGKELLIPFVNRNVT